jgi:hypothetical protein
MLFFFGIQIWSESIVLSSTVTKDLNGTISSSLRSKTPEKVLHYEQAINRASAEVWYII